MKFEVFNKREEKSGILFKKPVYVADIRVELTDQEFEALIQLANDKTSRNLSLGEWQVHDNQAVEIYLHTFYSFCKREQGVWNCGARSATPEGREYQITNRQDIAAMAKKAIDLRLELLNEGDQDIAIEL